MAVPLASRFTPILGVVGIQSDFESTCRTRAEGSLNWLHQHDIYKHTTTWGNLNWLHIGLDLMYYTRHTQFWQTLRQPHQSGEYVYEKTSRRSSQAIEDPQSIFVALLRICHAQESFTETAQPTGEVKSGIWPWQISSQPTSTATATSSGSCDPQLTGSTSRKWGCNTQKTGFLHLQCDSLHSITLHIHCRPLQAWM